MKSKKMLGVRVDFGLKTKDAINIIEKDLLADDKNHIVCTTNPEFIIDAQNDEEFRNIINDSSLSVPDGIGVIYANKYLNRVAKFSRNIFFPIRTFLYGIYFGVSSIFRKNNFREERISGVELTYEICDLSAKKGYSVFFLGGRAKNAVGKFDTSVDNDMATDAANVMRDLYPGVNIVGSTSKFNRSKEDDQKTIDYIKECMKEKGINKIDFLFVAYNHIHQEKWIIRNKDKIPAKVSIGCGGTFDFIVGYCTHPTEFYVKKNLGWLYRLIKQPWRVKRILKAFPIFPVKIYSCLIKNMVGTN